jgi:penicillin amidase
VAQRTVRAFEKHDPKRPELSDAVAVLRSWDGQMEKGTAAPMLATLLYQQVRGRLAEAASPGKSKIYDFQMAPSVVHHVLESGGNGWFKNEDEMLVGALSDAFEEGRKLQGGNVKHWDYGKYNELTINQPVDSQIPLLGSYFNIGPIAMSGSSTTVKQTTHRLGPSMRFIADLSDWERSLNNITAGESGQILSGHYSDQWSAYYVGRSFKMQFGKVDAKATLVVRPSYE